MIIIIIMIAFFINATYSITKPSLANRVLYYEVSIRRGAVFASLRRFATSKAAGGVNFGSEKLKCRLQHLASHLPAVRLQTI
jgi:hypothetical protein